MLLQTSISMMRRPARNACVLHQHWLSCSVIPCIGASTGHTFSESRTCQSSTKSVYSAESVHRLADRTSSSLAKSCRLRIAQWIRVSPPASAQLASSDVSHVRDQFVAFRSFSEHQGKVTQEPTVHRPSYHFSSSAQHLPGPHRLPGFCPACNLSKVLHISSPIKQHGRWCSQAAKHELQCSFRRRGCGTPAIDISRLRCHLIAATIAVTNPGPPGIS